MPTHSSVLAWRIPGMGEPGGLPSLGLHRVGHDWSNLAAVDCTLRHKSNLSTFKKTEIISSIFSHHNAMRLDNNYKKKTVRNTNTWKLNNTRNKKRNQKIYRNKWQRKHNKSKPMECSKSSSKREVFYSNRILPQETRKASNRQPNFTPKTTEKRRTKTPKLEEGKKS